MHSIGEWPKILVMSVRQFGGTPQQFASSTPLISDNRILFLCSIELDIVDNF